MREKKTEKYTFIQLRQSLQIELAKYGSMLSCKCGYRVRDKYSSQSTHPDWVWTGVGWLRMGGGREKIPPIRDATQYYKRRISIFTAGFYSNTISLLLFSACMTVAYRTLGVNYSVSTYAYHGISSE